MTNQYNIVTPLRQFPVCLVFHIHLGQDGSALQLEGVFLVRYAYMVGNGQSDRGE